MDDMRDLLLHPVVMSCIDHRIPITIEDGKIKVHGFYKSDHVELVMEEGKLIAKSRYNENRVIETFQGLAEFNFYWWKISRTRSQAWRVPENYWINILRDFELITIEVSEIKTVKENTE